MDSYRERLQEHLADYKRQRLGIYEDGIWVQNGKIYPHILPINLYRLNIIETVRAEFWRSFKKSGIKLHRDFHHLSSSQALTFNLFFPWLGISAFQPKYLLCALNLPDKPLHNWAFECVLDNIEGTNFDVFIEFFDKSEVLIEVKLSEENFGLAKANPKHIWKLKNVYWENLKDKVLPEALKEEFFFANYQILRNISYADPRLGRKVIFLIPLGNITLCNYLETLLNNILYQHMKESISVLYLEYFLDKLISEADERTKFQAELIKEKYICQKA